MSKIKLLEKSVYEKIAAGECVEKPASIVKELVENSFDAGATEIHVEIQNGGISKIIVKDNGCGIESEDLLNAFTPHATSKISNADDLFNLSTMGFRGEALSSISAVSMVELITKTDNDETGSKVVVNGGEFGEITQCASSRGTYICVQNLFYNIPARAKFLRKPKQEESEITTYIEKLMLSNPNISFKYVVDGKIIYNTKSCELIDNIYTIYGDIVDNLIKVNYNKNGFEVSGYISKPDFTKNNRTYQSLFVNNRFVQNFMISNAIQNAYGDFLMKGKFPMYILKLKMPANQLDVNVHPNKLEIRFENSNFIYGIFNTAIYETLFDNAHNISRFQQLEESKTTARIEQGPFEESVYNIEKSNSSILENKNTTNNEINPDISKTSIFSIPSNEKKDYFTFKSNSLNVLNEEILLSAYNVPEKTNEIKIDNTIEIPVQEKISELKDSYKIIGTIFETYIIIEKEQNIYILDQHASHERLLYDKIMNEVKNSNITSQNLIVPYILNVNTKESQFLNENIDTFNQCGFDIVEFGHNCFKINSIPYILQNINLQKYFNSILEDCDKLVKKPLDYIKEYFTQKACKAAVKAGMTLSDFEIKTLFSMLNKENNVLLCPHGRPIILSLTKKDIEKMFKRIV